MSAHEPSIAIQKQRRFAKTLAAIIVIILMVALYIRNHQAYHYQDLYRSSQDKLALVQQYAKANGIKIPPILPAASPSPGVIIRTITAPTVTVVGTPGSPGSAGLPGTPGINGKDAPPNTTPGPPGSNGISGVNGKDGQTIVQYEYTTANSDGSMSLCTFSTVQPLECHQVTAPTTTTTVPPPTTTTTVATAPPIATTTTTTGLLGAVLGGL